MSALRWLPALAWAGLIFSLSAQPRLPELPFAFDGFDKLAHAGAYGVLAACVLFARRWPGLAGAKVPVLVALGYGALDELHQAFVPGRTPDVFDLIADVSGALLAVGGYLALARWRARRLPESLRKREGQP